MKTIRQQSLLLLLLCLIIAPAPAQKKSGKAVAAPAPPAYGNVESITAAQLKDYLEFIASDELEGRDTPSRGLDTAARFIATHLSRWGLKPAGDNGTYFQHFALRRNRVDPAQTWAEINGQRFSFGDDFLTQFTAGSVSAPLIYVGNGWMIKGKNLNPYDKLDVKDKIVVAVTSLPKGVTFSDLKGKQGEDWDNPVHYAQTHGARAVIAVPQFQTLIGWSQSRQFVTERGTVLVEKYIRPDTGAIPVITVSPRMLNALFQGEKQNATMIFNRATAGEAIEGFDLSPNKKVSLNVAIKSEPAQTQNIVAMLEGTDPTLKNEYIAIGAHYDHVGIGTPVNGDAIYNGADDDGSGTVAVMALAEAYAKGPRPKRSIIFVWHAGEEHGLWGSAFITDQPPVPISQIVTQLNIDMIGRARQEGDTKPANQALPAPGEVFVIGSKMMSTDLGELSERVNNSFLKLKFNYKYDDPKDPERFFYRSDHFNYARKGVPIIFYMDGSHEDYHRPSDSVEKIDFAQMEKVTRTVYATAWELGNAAARPRVDKPLPAEVIGN